ncbi:pyridoxamine 5'-phosphate oxidase [Devosia sp. Root685]|nr:pyridoxamine 5'-phosphate oxidase [Devosia sp. Root685]KRA95213.1 pyridoxamine 5'-phosphate oxidase [Devosia sp. Root685]
MLQTLTERLFDDGDRSGLDPFAVFEEWFALAQESEANDPHAMALASADAAGMPDVRMVLLNARDKSGFCFFTNFESDKGRQLLANPQASAVFHWKSLRRQVRLRGPVEVVSPIESDTYFASRHRGSQIASSASLQSRPLENRETLIARVEALTNEIGTADVVRPDHWAGFRIKPTMMEFWKDGEYRLHDRVRFTRETPDAGWHNGRLYP